MAPFHPSVVLLASQRVTHQFPSQRAEETPLQSLNLLGVITAKLLTPIGLKDDLMLHLMSSQPQKHDNHSRQAISAVEVVSKQQEAQAGASITEGELIAGQMEAAEMLPEGSSQGLLIQHILHICLEEGQGLLFIPGPMGGVEGAALSGGVDQAIAIKDMADGMGEREMPRC